jgi:hypothetical protein
VVNQSFEYLKKLRNFFYGMLELKDKSGGRFHYPELQANVLTPYILNPITKTAPL